MRIPTVILCVALLLSASADSQVSAPTMNPATSPSHKTMIDPLSVRSLLMKLFCNHQLMGTATGFIVQKGDKYYLVTNWHVLNDKRPDNGQSLDPRGRTPDEVVILHNAKGHLGQWTPVSEPLFDDQHRSRIIEHPLHQQVDVVFLPLTHTTDVDLYPVDLALRNIPMQIRTAAEVSIVGFPFGQASFGGLPIWKSGAVASDPDIDYANSPQFLVDTTSRPGMSGSPVYARRVGGYQDESGNYDMVTGVTDRFMGIYAGDIDQFSEVGRVWKASAIMDIYNSLP